jgi:hypothetical protein
MVKVISNKPKTIKLTRNNKTIERPLIDYQRNKNLWHFRGFKPVEDVVKVENKVEDKVVNLKPKRTKRKKQDEQVDLVKE